MNEKRNIFDFIKSEEAAYRTTPTQIVDGYEWNMYEHIRLTSLYKHSQYSTGKDDSRPFKNILRPILNLQYRAEGFDVKDIQLFVNDSKNYYKSFLIKKFHERWARQNDIDTFIDDLVETYVDYGGSLVKDVSQKKPEVVPWQRIAFCDQTDILSGPIAEKHQYAPDQLKDMEASGWGNEKNGATMTLDQVITLAENYKQETQSANGKKTKTPGKYIEVYEIHGMFPNEWLDKEGEEATETYDEAEETFDNQYSRQLHIVCFYNDRNDNKQGITLFKGKEAELPYKFVARDKIYGRALGMGGAEELFEAQVWTNYNEIRKKDMLDSASKIILQYAGDLKGKSKLKSLDNLSIVETEDGKRIEQINTAPVNLPLFERATADWDAHAKLTGAANESILGESPASGTPFQLQQLVVAEAHSLHDYRKGKLATFLDEIYRDWVIPYISKEVSKGIEFLAELDLDELQSVADNLVICETNKRIVTKILNGEIVDDSMVEQFKQETRDIFMKGGNKKFLEILKNEFKDAAVDVYVNIAGKQKDLAKYTDKLVNIFRQIISSPGVLDDPRLAKIFNEILESSGLSPVDFYQKPQVAQPQPSQNIPLYEYNQRRLNVQQGGLNNQITDITKNQ